MSAAAAGVGILWAAFKRSRVQPMYRYMNANDEVFYLLEWADERLGRERAACADKVSEETRAEERSAEDIARDALPPSERRTGFEPATSSLGR
jgi:hypothetical protein